ncbi:nucleoside triphosphate pyrophosphohydrolase family protein [Leptospirillum ferriphilum]|uniref:nucleoside triphosphate pyrophosphohydrolase family protein n=1 Tax=Leptospirillum ferriphilum TaxID=178606 RepID=UPI0006B1B4E5|nr:nucleoside triphosphate pyrophosphohydrolase family protein [Leptospirillum ferriphilum]
MDFETYKKESSRTASGEFHREVVSDFLLENTLVDVIRIGSILDQVKKGLFYGKPLCGDEIKTEGSQTHLDPSRIDTNLLHAVIGVLTESVEILEALQGAMQGNPLDRVNLMEELGDIEWYMAMAYRSIGTTPGNVREINIAKLKARYPEKFTEEHAINRDLIQERYVLENSGGKE